MHPLLQNETSWSGPSADVSRLGTVNRPRVGGDAAPCWAACSLRLAARSTSRLTSASVLATTGASRRKSANAYGEERGNLAFRNLRQEATSRKRLKPDAEDADKPDRETPPPSLPTLFS